MRKRDTLSTALAAFLLAALVSAASMEALVTGFGLTLEWPCLLPAACVAAGALAAVLLPWRWGGLSLAAAFSVGTMALLWETELIEQFLGLVYRLSYVYDRAYHWGYLRLVEGEWNAWAADLPLALWGAALACLVARAVTRGRGMLPAALMSLLPAGACFVVTDTVPEPVWLYALLLGWGILRFSALARAENPARGSRFAAAAAVPLAVLLGLLFYLVPQESYVNKTEDVRTWLRDNLLQSEGGISLSQNLTPAATTAVQSENERVDLSALGAQPESDTVVLYVQPEVGGAVYLRELDYDSYTGLGWESTAARAESFGCSGLDLGTVSVETVGTLKRLLLPYYPQNGLTLVGGGVKNTALSTAYTYRRSGVEEESYALAAATASDYAGREEYLALPDSTRAYASAILEGILGDAQTPIRQAEAIGSYLRGKAAYDRQTTRMPSDEEDFAVWFLRDSDRGYCVHFATAAVVLLRAAGVEARFVTGYMVRTQAGERTAVTVSDAHAWAEYYEPTLGTWLVLEATPSQTTAARETQGTEAAQAPETAATPARETAAAESTRPETVPTEEPARQDSREAPAWAVWLGVLLGAAALLEMQRLARRAYRRYRRTHGGANARAIAQWQEVKRLAKALGQEPPERLEILTGKAKFSQHTLTDQELARYDTYRAAAVVRLQKGPLLRKLYARYILALL